MLLKAVLSGFPETALLWISSPFYDLSLTHNLDLAELPSFTPEMFSLNLPQAPCTFCFGVFHGFRYLSSESSCQMCIFSPDPFLELGDGQLYWCHSVSLKLLCMNQTHSDVDLLFQSVNKCLVKYVLPIKHHSRC